MRQRQYLAGSSRPGFPTHLRYAGPDDLLAFSLTDERAGLDRVRDGIRQLVEEQLATTGALLIRGLSRPVPDNQAFSKIVEGLGTRYGSASRQAIVGKAGDTG